MDLQTGVADSSLNNRHLINNEKRVTGDNFRIKSAMSMANIHEQVLYEYSEIGWEGPTDELAFFILIGGCQCVGDDETLPMLDENVSKIGISFISHKKYKTVLQILYISKEKQNFET